MNVSEVNALLAKNKPLDGYLDIPEDVYHHRDINALSHSSLKLMKESPSKFKWNMEHPRPQSRAQSLGTLVHKAVLEPDEFEKLYAPMPKFDKPTKAGKAGLAEWEEANPGRTGIAQDEWSVIERIYDRLHHDDFFSKFVKSGVKEKSFFHQDEETGVWLKTRPDNCITDGEVIVDLKTCENAQPWIFQRDISTWSYDTQAAMYVDVVSKVMGFNPTFVIIAVEKGRDNDVNLYYFNKEDLAESTKVYRSWLTKYAECMKSGKWPGYERQFIRYDMPEWKKLSSD